MTNTRKTARGAPRWLIGIAVAGAIWNIFGLTQLDGFIFRSRSSLMMKGMSAPAADLYYGLPSWMALAFAIGTFGGLIGSAGLGFRQRWTIAVLSISLAGYLALYAGDVAYGVFVVIPGQMMILSFVVAFAMMLLAVGLFARRRGLLR